MKKQFKISKGLNESELFKLFGRYARYLFGSYIITFNGKDLSADNPSKLFDKVKKEYADYVQRNK